MLRTFPGKIKHTEETVGFETSDTKVFWNETIKKTKKNLLEAVCIGISERLFTIEQKFWVKLRYLEKQQES